ncbi:PAS domain-containing sensor histidine kinase [Aestuariivita sp.]|uniref:PAS domain-containing sensor histidine kinase n=1 Tax=Aestuariivita sp. TaxID=1872407 RepID=UPI00216CEA90|nr:PAS domain-containing sensor histidine kinase [Aestuariivita sp.]MCE8007773.1 response regulator [Aestuariivita sp.]
MPNSILSFWREGGEDLFDAVFMVAPILMHSIDKHGILLNVSAYWAEKLGYSQDEMIGRKITEFMTQQSRDKAEGTVLPEFLSTGEISNIEYDFVRKNGTVIPVLLSAVAQFSREGEFLRSMAVVFDNSENKRLYAELNHKLRMEALGQLVGGVAHDFNNILSVIQGNLEFLKEDPDSEERGLFLQDALRSSHRGASLTQMLLSYGQRSHLEPRDADLNLLVRDMDHMLRRVLPNKLDLSVVTATGLWGVHLDPHQLETALINIVNNAKDAMPKGGKITIETCNVRISKDYVVSRDEGILPGRYVMLAISDTGDGISAEDLEHIFEPYYSTKPFGQGSGLGLSMVFGYVKQSGGTIRVYSEAGFGSTFKLYFPATRFDLTQEEQDQQWQSGDGVPSPLSEILVVEDEHDVRRVLANQIKKAGLNVAQAASGDEAFTLLTTGYRPKLLVTDIIMPGALQGPELAEKARELIEDLNVIFVSGLPQEAAIHGNALSSSDVLIPKPIDSAMLIREIGKMLRAQS